MQIHFLRHATFILRYANATLLIDPMLSRAGAMDPVQNAANQKRIPLVALPLSDAELHDVLNQTTGVLVTHTHRDHWDPRAVELIPKTKPILCQPEDEKRIRDAGFVNVMPVRSEYEWQGIHFGRTGGEHGTGEIGKQMAPVSGFVLRANGEPTLYIAGDTIWCRSVETALQNYSPNIVVVNAGAAQFLTDGPITMTAEDVVQVCRARPAARVMAVHMEAINHCGLTRADLAQHLQNANLSAPVLIPADGERLAFNYQ